MFEVLIKINCPAQSGKAVNNEKKRNGGQNLLSPCCGKQVLPTYHNKGAKPGHQAAGAFCAGRRRNGKYWLLYACCPETDQKLACSCGGRSAKTVREL